MPCHLSTNKYTIICKPLKTFMLVAMICTSFSIIIRFPTETGNIICKKTGFLPKINCTPIVKRYDILNNDWGAFMPKGIWLSFLFCCHFEQMLTTMQETGHHFGTPGRIASTPMKTHLFHQIFRMPFQIRF